MLTSSIRTDLAYEEVELHRDTLSNSIEESSENIEDISVYKVIVKDEEGAKMLSKPVGTYVTIEPKNLTVMPANFEVLVDIIAKQIKALLPKKLESVLVVGLGNHNITPDALGTTAIGYTLATRHIVGSFAKEIGLDNLKSVSAIATGVLGQTGIESCEIIKAIVDKIAPSVVIVIDSFACKSLDRLGKTVQISNTGISPGSGVANSRKEISKGSLGVEVISIGVPMVVDLHTIASDYTKNEELPHSDNANMMVTPREIDVIIEHGSKLVGYSINKALQESLTLEDIMALT